MRPSPVQRRGRVWSGIFRNANPRKAFSLAAAAICVWLMSGSCAGNQYGALQPSPNDLCKCLPIEPDIADYRHIAKHVAIPTMNPVETSVDDILTWPQDPIPLPPDQPRTGRELQVFHVGQAFVQEASVNAADCDVHMEISQAADKNAPRVIVETPVDTEYCTARQTVQTQFAKHGFRLDSQHGGELPQPLPAEVSGMAFEDFEHNRGSAQVSTVWELHPAMVHIP
jgi:hypothetical protein